MYRDLNSYQPRREPERKPTRLTSRQENILVSAIAANLILALFSPFCGSSLIEAVIYIYRWL